MNNVPDTGLIDDLDDPRLHPYLGLREARERQRRERPGGDLAHVIIVEGDPVIDRALAAGLKMRSVLVDAKRSRELPEAWRDHPGVLLGSAKVMSAVSGRDRLRDPLADFERPLPRNPAELVADARKLLVVEGVNNPTNMGSLFRNAAALGADAVLLDPTCCDPFYRRALRVSMGQVFAVPHAELAAFPAGLDIVHARGIHTIALTPGAEAVLEGSRRSDQPVALLVGAEGPGLTEATLAAANEQASIEMHANVDSLNVATAAAIALWALG